MFGILISLVSFVTLNTFAGPLEVPARKSLSIEKGIAIDATVDGKRICVSATARYKQIRSVIRCYFGSEPEFKVAIETGMAVIRDENNEKNCYLRYDFGQTIEVYSGYDVSLDMDCL